MMFLKSLPWILGFVAGLWYFAWQSPFTYQSCQIATVGVCGGWLATLIGLSKGRIKEQGDGDRDA